MKRALLWGALLLSLVAPSALADLPPMSPCPPPASGRAVPVDPYSGAPIPGGEPIPFHLAYVCAPVPCLIWGDLGMTGSACDASTFGTPIGAPPVTIIHFYEDAAGRVWAKKTVIDVEGGMADSWFRVTSP